MLDAVDSTVCSNVFSEIWKNTIRKIVREGPYDASDMKGTSDYIIGHSGRMSPSWLQQEGVSWEVSQGAPLTKYVERLNLLFFMTIHWPISSRWYAI